MKKLFLLFVLIYFSNCIATPANQLRGTVSIDVKAKTKPLDPLLWPGNYFDEKVATALLKNQSINTNIWKKIPAWQAGTWESAQVTNTKVIKYVNGQSVPDTTNGVYAAKSTESFGWQKDKNGDIWDWYTSGYWTEARCDSSVVYAFVKFSAPGTGNYPDKDGESIVFNVDKSNNQIIDVYQRKAWKRYVYLAPGLMKVEEVQTIYNEKGEPDCTAWITHLNKRTKTFAEAKAEVILNNDDEFLRQRFFDYLKNNGLANLIPKQLTNNGLPLSDEDINMPTSGEQTISRMAMPAQLQGHEAKPVERTGFERL